MHVRSAVVLVSVLLAAPALAAERPPQEETAAVTDVSAPTQLTALPPLLRDAQGATDAGRAPSAFPAGSSQ
jgi:hypothetical protein